VSGNSQPSLWTNNLPSAFGREIVLADVYAFEIGCQAEVGTIIHDQPYHLPALGEKHALAQFSRFQEYAGPIA